MGFFVLVPINVIGLVLQLGSRIGSGSPVWPCRSLWDGVSQAVGGFDSLLASVSF